MRRARLLIASILGASAVCAVAALARPAEPVEFHDSPRATWFFNGIFVGKRSHDPAAVSFNAIRAVAVRQYEHATPLVDGGTCAGAVLGMPGAVGFPGDPCTVKSSAYVFSPNGLRDWACSVTDAGTVTVQRCNTDTVALPLDAGVGDKLYIEVISHQKAVAE